MPIAYRVFLNTTVPTAGSRAGQVGEWSDQWKVLVYDKPCRNIISTLMHVTQLRKQGVTLHMLVSHRSGALRVGLLATLCFIPEVQRISIFQSVMRDNTVVSVPRLE